MYRVPGGASRSSTESREAATPGCRVALADVADQLVPVRAAARAGRGADGGRARHRGDGRPEARLVRDLAGRLVEGGAGAAALGVLVAELLGLVAQLAQLLARRGLELGLDLIELLVEQALGLGLVVVGTVLGPPVLLGTAALGLLELLGVLALAELARAAGLARAGPGELAAGVADGRGRDALGVRDGAEQLEERTDAVLHGLHVFPSFFYRFIRPENIKGDAFWSVPEPHAVRAKLRKRCRSRPLGGLQLGRDDARGRLFDELAHPLAEPERSDLLRHDLDELVHGLDLVELVPQPADDLVVVHADLARGDLLAGLVIDTVRDEAVQIAEFPFDENHESPLTLGVEAGHMPDWKGKVCERAAGMRPFFHHKRK